MMIEKKIMILGGGKYHVPLIIAAKEAGYYVVLCDYVKDCQGKMLCDKHYLISILDKTALLEIAIMEGVDGIVTNSEPALHIVSYLTDKLGLPSVPYGTMERFLNKYLMRDCLTEKGLSNVLYKLCQNVEEAVDFYRSLDNPKIIMKPLDNSASRGVFSITSENDINNYFGNSLKCNRRQHAVLVEEYIEGTEFTVDGICIGGKHTTLGISKKKHYPHNENVAYELSFSYMDNEYDYDVLRNLNDQIVEAGGLTYGLTHAEYKFCNGTFYLIEVAARGGGGFISTLIIPFLTDTDTVKIFINCATGCCKNQKMIIPAHSKKRVAVLEFFSTPNGESGIVEDIQGIEFLEHDTHIVKYELAFKVGDYIKPASNDAERIGYYIAFSESKEELVKLMSEVDKNFIIKLRL